MTGIDNPYTIIITVRQVMMNGMVMYWKMSLMIIIVITLFPQIVDTCGETEDVCAGKYLLH